MRAHVIDTGFYEVKAAWEETEFARRAVTNAWKTGAPLRTRQKHLTLLALAEEKLAEVQRKAFS